MSASPSPTAPPSAAPRPAYPSDLTRSKRRRDQRERLRELARRAGDPCAIDFECAKRIREIASAEHDPTMRRELYRIARNYQMRHAGDEHRQRMAVLKVMERTELVTVADLVTETLLSAELIQAFLDEWSSAEVDLVYLTTMPGKGKCGRKGTLRYYGLLH